MDDERFLNSYHNASTPPGPDVPADLAGFMVAADPVLAQAAELARVLARAHQGAATQLIGEGWAHARKYFSLSEKYAAWADYHTPARGVGIHAYARTVDRPIRLTDRQLRAHPEWRNFGVEQVRHPPMRGWLAVPLIGSDGANYGFIQASDRLEGDFTAQDEAHLVRLASLTSTALDALAQLHLPAYRAKVADLDRRQAMRGKPSWWDILVDDLDVAQRFYSAVFGWTFPMSGPDFVVVFDGTEQVGQLYASSEQVSGRGIRMYFDTDDLEGILAKVASAGGIVKTERTLIGPEMGWYGEFTDPSGVTIGLHTSVPAK